MTVLSVIVLPQEKRHEQEALKQEKEAESEFCVNF